MEVIDNFLDEKVFLDFKNKIFSEEFPWYWCDNTIDKKDNPTCNELDNYQLIHNFYYYNMPVSNNMELLNPVLDRLSIMPWNCIKVKLNATTRTQKIVEHGFHIDISDGFDRCNTAVLYLNTNNGYTLFEDGTKVESVANRLVTFNNFTKHSGSTNTCDEPYSLVLNMDYI